MFFRCMHHSFASQQQICIVHKFFQSKYGKECEVVLRFLLIEGNLMGYSTQLNHLLQKEFSLQSCGGAQLLKKWAVKTGNHFSTADSGS